MNNFGLANLSGRKDDYCLCSDCCDRRDGNAGDEARSRGDGLVEALMDIDHRRGHIFGSAVAAFRAAAGLHEFDVRQFPVTVPEFGHVRRDTWNHPARAHCVWLDRCSDPAAFCATAEGRLAVVMAWPCTYSGPDGVRDWVAEVLPAPQFLTALDPAADGRCRGTAGIYSSPTTVGWIGAHVDTLGRARAEEVVAAFTSGGWGLAGAVAAQRDLDAEEAALCAQRDPALTPVAP